MLKRERGGVDWRCVKWSKKRGLSRRVNKGVRHLDVLGYRKRRTSIETTSMKHNASRERHGSCLDVDFNAKRRSIQEKPRLWLEIFCQVVASARDVHRRRLPRRSEAG
jgi:hypothetical protein